MTDATADHRDPSQWLFYVVAETDLPAQASIGLPALLRLTDPVRYYRLAAKVAELVRIA